MAFRYDVPRVYDCPIRREPPKKMSNLRLRMVKRHTKDIGKKTKTHVKSTYTVKDK